MIQQIDASKKADFTSLSKDELWAEITRVLKAIAMGEGTTMSVARHELRLYGLANDPDCSPWDFVIRTSWEKADLKPGLDMN